MTAPLVQPAATGARGRVAPVAWWAISGPALAAMAALLLTSTRYGYHRDELYFMAAGAHFAWGYPDQPLLTPLLAHAMDSLDSGSLTVLRLPAIMVAGITTVTTGLTAREFGGGRRAQLIAAACWAVGALCLVTGHFLTTTTVDVGATAVVCFFLARLLRTGDLRLWLPAGFALGIGLLNKSLVGTVMLVVVAAIAAAGPRWVLRSWWLAAGTALAVLGALPYAVWQLQHGIPQLDLARSIAQSGDEGGRIGFIPFQIVLISPLLVFVWLAGLRALLRDPALRAQRCFGIAFLALFPIFMISGGKAYYTSGLYPVLLAAGAVVIERSMLRRPSSRRTARLVAFIAATAAISAVMGLCLLPPDRLQGSIVMALNPDTGEMVGWPRFANTMSSVYHSLPPPQRSHTVIFTGNYGEAGAIAHYGPSRGLPYPYSGHNAWTFWGPPPDSDTTAVLVGYGRAGADSYFTGCRVRARIDNGVGLENDEQGTPVLGLHRRAEAVVAAVAVAAALRLADLSDPGNSLYHRCDESSDRRSLGGPDHAEEQSSTRCSPRRRSPRCSSPFPAARPAPRRPPREPGSRRAPTPRTSRPGRPTAWRRPPARPARAT